MFIKPLLKELHTELNSRQIEFLIRDAKQYICLEACPALGKTNCRIILIYCSCQCH